MDVARFEISFSFFSFRNSSSEEGTYRETNSSRGNAFVRSTSGFGLSGNLVNSYALNSSQIRRYIDNASQSLAGREYKELTYQSCAV